MNYAKDINRLKKVNLRTQDIYAYTRLHLWVNKQMGKASYCSNDSSHKSSRFHWANISGEYKKDLSDWRQLCASCNIKEGVTDEFRKLKSLQAIGNQNRAIAVLAVSPTGCVHYYTSAKKASEELGVLRTAICNVLSGIARTAGGYRWRKVGVS